LDFDWRTGRRRPPGRADVPVREALCERRYGAEERAGTVYNLESHVSFVYRPGQLTAAIEGASWE
jgi:hypothetical protein